MWRRPVSVVQDIGSRVTGMVMAIAVLVIIVLALGIWLVHRYLVNSLKRTLVQADPLHCTSSTAVSKSLPAFNNGVEYSVAFWTYVQNNITSDKSMNVLSTHGVQATIDKNGKIKIVWKSATDDDDDDDDDKKKKKKKKDDDDDDDDDKKKKKKKDDDKKKKKKVDKKPKNVLGSTTVNYMPLQRWVHIMVVVKQFVVILYIDGEVYSVEQVESGKKVALPSAATTIGAPNGADVFVSRVVIYNYAASVFEARRQQGVGPVDNGLLGVLGIKSYKLQWPLVKTSDDADVT
jgi:hypothetical protein